MIRTEQIAAGPGQASVTLDQPLEHLVACHRRIEERLEILERAANYLLDRREEALEAIENCFRFLDSNGVWHTADEEESVFPRLRGKVKEQEDRFLRELEADHREVEGVYEEVKARCRVLSEVVPLKAEDVGSFVEVVRRLCRLYRAHIAAENDQLISVARGVLDAAQLSAISREMKARRGLTL
ncbi:MAG: hemerythrin domain-containing protein [Bryobacteraceae bacterium]|nr:hemerythrin domain-containing protein [Bryobacteraceae bacterium]